MNRRPAPSSGILFRGMVRRAKPLYATKFHDNHPDNLRMWREHAPDNLCPDGWFAVRVAPEKVGGRAVFLSVEMDPDDARSLITVDQELRTLWWTPSEELAREVVRQLKNHERRMFSPCRVDEYPGLPMRELLHMSGGEIFRPLNDPAHSGRSRGTDTFRVFVEVFRREGDRASPPLTTAVIPVSALSVL